MADYLRTVTPPGRYAPLADDHPAVGTPCARCARLFQAGDRIALCCPVPASADDQAKALDGRAHTAEVIPVHEDDCDRGEI